MRTPSCSLYAAHRCLYERLLTNTTQYYQVIDATRTSTSELVAIKSFLTDTDRQELEIAQFFSTIEDPTNHCVTVHQILPDPFNPRLAFMVMPYLRPCDDPDWSTLGDVVDFVGQTLEVS